MKQSLWLFELQKRVARLKSSAAGVDDGTDQAFWHAVVTVSVDPASGTPTRTIVMQKQQLHLLAKS